MSGEQRNGDQLNGDQQGDELRDELFFTAVRYALEELSPPARDAFEQRLLVDQQARECLAEAVSVSQFACQGLRGAVEPAALVGSRATAGRPRRAIVGTSLALAASLLFVVGLAQLGKRGDLPTADTMRDERGRQLAVAWVTSGEWIAGEDGQPGVSMYEISGHERRAPPGDKFAGESEEGDEEIAWLDKPIEAQSDSATAMDNDWLFEAVATPGSLPGHHQEG